MTDAPRDTQVLSKKKLKIERLVTYNYAERIDLKQNWVKTLRMYYKACNLTYLPILN